MQENIDNRKYLYIAIAFIIIVVLVIISSLLFLRNSSTPPSPDSLPITHTPSPTITTILTVSKTPRPNPSPITGDAINDLVQRAIHRKPLSATDKTVKEGFIKEVGGKSGVLYTGSTFIIDYSADADIFHVEIISTNIAQAQDDAINWLRSQGITKDGICKFPIIFFSDPKRFDPKQSTGLEFYAMPSGC